MPIDLDLAMPAIQTGARRLGNADQRLVGPAAQKDSVFSPLIQFEYVEMLLGKFAITRHAVIGHASVQGGADRHATRPILGRQLDTKPGQMGIGHTDETTFAPPCGLALGVPDPEVTVKQPPLEVEFLAKREHVHLIHSEPFAVVNTEGERQPVRQIDEILVFNGTARYLGGKAVISARQIRARIVHVVGHGIRSGASGPEIAITQRAEGFT